MVLNKHQLCGHKAIISVLTPALFSFFPPPTPPAGESINPRVAGLIGRSGPQNKQPFMVAFFKATEVHLRSIRSASGGGKQRNPNRAKAAKNQEALRVANIAGTGSVSSFLQTCTEWTIYSH